MLGNSPTTLCIENVGYQPALSQTPRDLNIPVVDMNPRGLSKAERLRSYSYLIENAAVVFPKQGAELLIRQMVGLGTEKYDDLVDAFVYVVKGLIESRRGGAVPGFFTDFHRI
jgi:phage terminase large subunit-like protein